jgi:hypothetical protein
MKHFILICILSFLFLPLANAQDRRRDLIKEYEQFRNQAKQEYLDFRARANAEYAEFMRRAWQQYESVPEIPAPTVPDPPKPPVIMPEDEKDRIPENKPVPYEEVIPVPVVIKQPEPVAPVPEIPKKKDVWLDFSVFGTACKVRLSGEDRFTLANCTENAIADAWQILSQAQYNNLIRDCLELRARLNLCDWAYLQLLQQLSLAFFGKESNETVLLTAFLYSQSGYKIRLARSEANRLYMLVASRHAIYNMNYYKIDGGKFYPLNCREESLFICNNTFPNEQALSLSIEKEQHFSMNAGDKRTLTSKKYPNITTIVSSNKNLIDFYNTYPQSYVNNDATTKWTFYANTPLSRSVRETLYPALRNAIQDKSEQEAANMLINFVQTAFEYDYDDKIWGGDRPFFADETVYYPFSDCEDRSILFSRLVRDLMNLKVVLLYYPGHLATAVQFNETIPGDYLLLNEKRYLVCDPTYIGANIGRTMPDMDNDKATVVFLE